jgi:hypothetical protein
MSLNIFFLNNNGRFIKIGVLIELFVYLMVQVNATIKTINLYKSFERYFCVRLKHRNQPFQILQVYCLWRFLGQLRLVVGHILCIELSFVCLFVNFLRALFADNGHLAFL